MGLFPCYSKWVERCGVPTSHCIRAHELGVEKHVCWKGSSAPSSNHNHTQVRTLLGVHCDDVTDTPQSRHAFNPHRKAWQARRQCSALSTPCISVRSHAGCLIADPGATCIQSEPAWRSVIFLAGLQTLNPRLKSKAYQGIWEGAGVEEK